MYEAMEGKPYWEVEYALNTTIVYSWDREYFRSHNIERVN